MPRRKRPLALLLSAILLGITLTAWLLSFQFPGSFTTQTPPDIYGIISADGEVGFIYIDYTRPSSESTELWQLHILGIIYATDDIIVDTTTGRTQSTLKIRWRTVAAAFLCTTAFLAWRFYRTPPPSPKGFDVLPPTTE